MADNLPDAVEPYPEISSKAYEHPADRAATAALKAVPMLDTVVRKLVEYSYERALRQSYLGNSVRVSERQLPELWASYRGVHRILDMPDDYDLYVSSSLNWNALTIGSQKPMLVIGSNLLLQLGPGEQRRSSPTSSGTSCLITCSTHGARRPAGGRQRAAAGPRAARPRRARRAAGVEPRHGAQL